MNIRADEYFILTRGYNLDPDKLEELDKKMRSASQAVAKNEADLKKFSKVVDMSRISDQLFDCFERQDAKLRDELRTAVADYVAYLGGNLYKSALEAYKGSDKPRYEIDASFFECLIKTNLRPLEEDKNIFSFPDCNTPEDIFEKAKQDILDRMEITIPRPLKNFITHVPDYMIIIQDKGTTEIFDGKMKAGEKREIKLNRSGREKMVREIEFVNQEFDETLTQFGLKEEEKFVANALCSLWDDNTRVFSLQTIASMYGGNDRETDSKASKQTLREIKEILRKLSTWTIINYSQEAIAYKDKFIEVLEPDGKLYKYEGPLFHVDIETTAKLNGTVTHEAVEISKEPILWKLAKMKAQFTKVPLSVFNTPGNLTSNKIELQMYLVERLTQMKRMKRKNTPLANLTIKWDTLLQRTGNADAKPSAKAKVKDKALALLDYWKQSGELLLDYAVSDEAIYIAIEEPHLKLIEKQRRTISREG